MRVAGFVGAYSQCFRFVYRVHNILLIEPRRPRSSIIFRVWHKRIITADGIAETQHVLIMEELIAIAQGLHIAFGTIEWRTIGVIAAKSKWRPNEAVYSA